MQKLIIFLIIALLIYIFFPLKIEGYTNYPYINNSEVVHITRPKIDNRNGNMRYPGIAYLGINSDKSYNFNFNNVTDDYNPSKSFPFLGNLF